MADEYTSDYEFFSFDDDPDNASFITTSVTGSVHGVSFDENAAIRHRFRELRNNNASIVDAESQQGASGNNAVVHGAGASSANSHYYNANLSATASGFRQFSGNTDGTESTARRDVRENDRAIHAGACPSKSANRRRQCFARWRGKPDACVPHYAGFK